MLCGAIGFEREVRDQPAGFGTHILLGLGATLFTLVSAYGSEPFTRAALGSGGLQFDPTRVSTQIVTGVGFLGAGAIIRRGGDVRGLTTAASLGARRLSAWLSAPATSSAPRDHSPRHGHALRPAQPPSSTRCASTPPDSRSSSKPGSKPQDALQVLRRHGIAVSKIDAEIDQGRAHYKLQARIPNPPTFKPPASP